MIESQTKLPQAEPGLPSIGARDGRVLATLRRQIEDRLQLSPDDGEARQSSHLVHLVAWGQVWLSLIRSRPVGTDIQSNLLLNRYALHLVVVLLAIGVITISRARMPSIDLTALAAVPATLAASETGVESIDLPVSTSGARNLVRNTALLFQAPVPHTIVPDRYQMAIITYTVQPNDTVWGIAQNFGIEVETIMWANPAVEKDPDLLSVNQVLTILPVNGIYYTVGAGDTLDKLAKTYKTSVEKVVGLELNGLTEPYALTPGQKIVLVDGSKPLPPAKAPVYAPLQYVGKAPANALTGSGRFMWPTVGYWSRGMSRYHNGVDIANRTGTPIYAADSGYVMLAGRDTAGYGLQIVLNHGNGYLTRYAHLSKILVKGGQSVKRGDKIGLMGSTGRSTGPHLHFEIIKNGAFVNPASYLPR